MIYITHTHMNNIYPIPKFNKMGTIFSTKCTCTARLDGKTAIITGANTGIGKYTVQDFYLRGARVILACRSLQKAEAAISEIKRECEGTPNLGSLNSIELDLANLDSVRNCADTILREEEKINILINNAGVMLCTEGKTKDGFETHIGINHFGHFLLTLLLLPKIIKSAPSRIVNVSSSTHAWFPTRMNIDDINWQSRSFSTVVAYCQSKLANVLFTKELARRLEEAKIDGVTTYALHPGVVGTELGRYFDDNFIPGTTWLTKTFIYPLLKSPQQGCQTSVYCSVDENAGKETGLYYADCKVKEPSTNSKNEEDAKDLWEVSCKLVGLTDYDPFSQLNLCSKYTYLNL